MTDDLMDTLELLLAETNRMERLRAAIDKLEHGNPHRLQLCRFMQRRISNLDGAWLQLQFGSYIAGHA